MLELLIRMKFVLFQDSLRLYLVNSPVVRAESLRFKRAGVFAVVSLFIESFVLPYYLLARLLVCIDHMISFTQSYQ